MISFYWAILFTRSYKTFFIILLSNRMNITSTTQLLSVHSTVIYWPFPILFHGSSFSITLHSLNRHVLPRAMRKSMTVFHLPLQRSNTCRFNLITSQMTRGRDLDRDWRYTFYVIVRQTRERSLYATRDHRHVDETRILLPPGTIS